MTDELKQLAAEEFVRIQGAAGHQEEVRNG